MKHLPFFNMKAWQQGLPLEKRHLPKALFGWVDRKYVFSTMHVFGRED